MSKARAGQVARIALGAIRLVNGTAALVVPAALAQRVGVDPATNPGTIYVLRLFGIRTILIGAELLVSDEEIRAKALRDAVVIHVSDTAAAAIAGARRHLPRRAAAIATLISTANVALSVIARRWGRDRP